MLELTAEQVAALAEIDAKGFVESVRQDLCKADPKLGDDATLSPRLWRAFKAARQFGIREDDNLVGFLRIEAYAPEFYEKPALRAWLTRPGRSADERFRDYQRIIRWKVEHPELLGGIKYGVTDLGGSRGSSGGTWAGLGARWRSLIGRRSGSGNG